MALNRVGLSTASPQYQLLAQYHVNESYLKILNLFDWTFLRNSDTLTLSPFYQAGLATGAAGSNQVTLTQLGTTTVGQSFVCGDGTIYTITAINGTVLTLNQPLFAEVLATTSFWIFSLLYPMASDINLPVEQNVYLGHKPKITFIPEWEMRERMRNPQFAAPRHWTAIYQEGNAAPQFLFYPFADQAYNLSYAYNRAIGSLVNATDLIIIPEPYRKAVVELAMAYLYLEVLGDLNMADVYAKTSSRTVKDMAIKYTRVTDKLRFDPLNYRERPVYYDNVITRMMWRV